MPDTTWSLEIIQELRPQYYDRFHCLAKECRLTCCAGWRITFNKKDFLALKRQKGSPELEKKLSQSVRRMRRNTSFPGDYGEFDLRGGPCPLLCEDGLCSLQRECGAEALPTVCRIFPRGGQFTPAGYLERSLSPACEAVLELLWDLPDGVEFVAEPLPKDRVKRLSFSVDTPLCRAFGEIRSLCIDFLQERRLPLHHRILLMGLALRKLADGGEEQDVSRWLAWARALLEDPEAGTLCERTFAQGGARGEIMFLSNALHMLLEVHSSDVQIQAAREAVLLSLGVSIRSRQETERIRLTLSPDFYRVARARFQETFAGREYFLENLMVSLFFRLSFPHTDSLEKLWKDYVNFCQLYSFYRFMAVMSCREGAPGDKAELFHQAAITSRLLLHDKPTDTALRDELFRNESSSLAHMAILLNG